MSIIPVTHIFLLDPPETVALAFESTFSIDTTTATEFKRISDQRQNGITASNMQSEAAIQCVQKYLPLLFGLKQAAEGLPPNFSKYLKISWNSSISSDKFPPNTFSHSNWYFEVQSTLTMYALLKRKIANENLIKCSEENFTDECVAPSNQLKEAAGVFTFIYESICAKFVVDTATYRYPESYAATFKVLSLVSLAECQEIVIKKAVRMKSMADNHIGMLCEGAHAKYQNALLQVQEITKTLVNDKKGVKMGFNANFQQYISLNATFWKAMAFKLVGCDYMKKFESGKAVAYMTKASQLLDSMECKPDPTIRYHHNLENFWNKILPERELVTILKEEYKHQNKTINHLSVPDEIPDVEEKCLAKPTPFELPPPTHIQITQQSSWCSIQ